MPEQRAADRGNAVVVEVRNLEKRYGHTMAVDRLTLIVRAGEVYGFLGANGAGKSTTLRAILGLIRPTSGSVKVLGQDPQRSSGLSGVGALVEAPAFYPYLSGRNNLKVLGRYSGVTSEGRIDEVLRQVGLAHRGKDKFKQYSLGMKQRLGVAAALLDDPKLLVLDEPTNGLDPKGMSEMRELIRKLGEGERTVLLSSHLMSEVEQVCDRVGVVRAGKMVAEGTVEEIRGKGGLLLKADPFAEAWVVAKKLPEVRGLEIRGEAIYLHADPISASEIGQKLFSAGVRVHEIREARQSLEEVFLELTSDKEGE